MLTKSSFVRSNQFSRSRLAAAVGVAAALGLASAVPNVQATPTPYIGVNFVEDNNTTPESLAATQSAGLYPQTNWNNTPYLGKTGNQETAAISNLNNASGSATGVSLSLVYYDAYASPYTATTPDGILLNNIVKTGASAGNVDTFEFSNVPAGTYDLVGYVALDTGIPDFIASFIGSTTVSTGATPLVETESASTPIFTVATTTTAGNYFELDGVSPSGGNLTLDFAGANSVNVGIAGIQLLSAPEPATLALLAIGGAGLLLIGRRKWA